MKLRTNAAVATKEAADEGDSGKRRVSLQRQIASEIESVVATKNNKQQQM